MRKNVYTKSMLRQPIHSLALAFLLFMGTFSFVLRSLEFLTVRDQIFRVADYYQVIGFLSGDDEFDDVNVGADFLENSPYIEFADRRRVAEGVLQDVLNSAVADPHGMNFEIRQGRMWSDSEIQPEFHDAFFYGELVEKIERVVGGWQLLFTVDEVVVGYPEHVVEGQSVLRMNFDLEEGEESAIDNLEIGERYFLRGMYNPLASSDVHSSDSWIPVVGDESDILLMQPLLSDGLWYVHVPYGESVDFMTPELDGILEEVEFLHHHHHAVQLRTTMDMALMPIMLEDAEMGYIVEGRPIDQEDYLNANPVAVIHYNFANIRDLNVGDTITVETPQMHHAKHEVSWMIGTSLATAQTFSDINVESVPQTEGLYEIELEIVGVYKLFRRVGGDQITSLSTHIYIPDSILPDDIEITSNRGESPDGRNYLPSTWYSFGLEDSRDEVAFIAEHRLPLEEMGFTLTVISNAQNFWESAEVILQSILFNGIVFCIVLVLVLMLVIFLFLRQRRKEFTVSRLLGYTTGRSVKEIFATATLFLVPITIGSVLAWLFARYTIVNTLQVFEELHEGYEAVFSLSIFWLIGLVALVFILAMLMVLIGTVHLIRRPGLQLLHRKD